MSSSVLCTAESAHLLAMLSYAASVVGLSILLTDSPGTGIALTAEYRPTVVLLDQPLLRVDQWSVPEQLHLVSPRSIVVLVVDDPKEWPQLPAFVDAIAARADPENVISVLRSLLPTARERRQTCMVVH